MNRCRGMDGVGFSPSKIWGRRCLVQPVTRTEFWKVQKDHFFFSEAVWMEILAAPDSSVIGVLFGSPAVGYRLSQRAVWLGWPSSVQNVFYLFLSKSLRDLLNNPGCTPGSNIHQLNNPCKIDVGLGALIASSRSEIDTCFNIQWHLLCVRLCLFGIESFGYESTERVGYLLTARAGEDNS